MQFPTTPSSGHGRRSSPPHVPNAPYMNARGLPPSPRTSAPPLAGRGLPPGAPYIQPIRLPSTSHPSAASFTIDGLMTPPTSPERLGGGITTAAAELHPLLRTGAQLPMSFSIASPIEHIRFDLPYNTTALSEPAIQPSAVTLIINVIGVFNIEVRSPHGRGLTVGDVLRQLTQAMSRQPQQHEIIRFPIEVQNDILTRSQGLAHGQPSFVRRVDLLGPRNLFAGLMVTHAANEVVFCELNLSARAR